MRWFSRPGPRWRPEIRAALPALLALSLLACNNKDEEVVYEQWNATDDTLDVAVGAALGDPVSIDLHSSTGAVVVGTATVDPGSGPVGTEHTLTVIVADEYANIVDRASVRTASGDRGEDEYDLVADSAAEGYFVLELVSVGEEGEQRTDTLTFRLWDIEGDDDGEGDTSDASE